MPLVFYLPPSLFEINWTNEKHHTKILKYLSTTNIDFEINISLNFQIVLLLMSDYGLNKPIVFRFGLQCIWIAARIIFIYEYEIGTLCFSLFLHMWFIFTDNRFWISLVFAIEFPLPRLKLHFAFRNSQLIYLRFVLFTISRHARHANDLRLSIIMSTIYTGIYCVFV